MTAKPLVVRLCPITALTHVRTALMTVSAALALAACGGGGGGGSATPPPSGGTPPPAPSTYTVGGTLTGLTAGASLSLSLGSQTVTLTADGNFSFPAGLNSGSTYSVSLTQAPAQGQCRVLDGSGTMASAAITNVRVACTPEHWIPNGAVTASALSADERTLYLAGTFSRMGPRTGAFVSVDPASGALREGGARVAGAVRAVAPDGSGGWYVTTALNSVNSELWRLTATGQRAPGFQVTVRGTVTAMALTDGRLHIGGDFLAVEGVPRRGYAVWDLNAGTLLNNSLQTEGPVESIAVGSTQIYLAGGFSAVGGQVRKGLAALDRNTGALLPWNPAATASNGAVWIRKLRAANGMVYVGGSFESVGGQARKGLAALDGQTALATAWNPAQDSTLGDGQVCALEVTDGAIYVGGRFTQLGGQARVGVAALNPTTGQATSWNPQIEPGTTMPASVCAIAVTPDQIYLGGDFKAVGGAARSGLAAVSPSSGAVSGFAQSLPLEGNWVSWIGQSNGSIWIGGDFSSYGGLARPGAAALDLRSGQLLDWAPNVSSSLTEQRSTNLVRQMLATPGGIVLAGHFDRINGVPHAGIGAVQATGTGPVLSWPATPSREWAPYVDALAMDGDTLYFGGDFDAVAGQVRSSLAAVDARTFALLPWATNTSGRSITQLKAVNGVLLAHGSFALDAGAPGMRSFLAFDRATGKRLNWDPNPRAGDLPLLVERWDANASTVYVSGAFISLSGAPFGEATGVAPQPERVQLWPPANRIAAHRVFLANGLLFVSETVSDVYTGLVSTVLRQRELDSIAVVGSSNALSLTLNDSMMDLLAPPGAYVLTGRFTQANGQMTGSVLIVPR